MGGCSVMRVGLLLALVGHSVPNRGMLQLVKSYEMTKVHLLRLSQ
ncbi:hypothetical protein LINGRAHAP2_LOCUS24695 [Linum grandiflorum]